MNEEKNLRTHKFLSIMGVVLCLILIPILIVNLTLIAKSYINKDEDDLENGIVGGLIVEPVNPNEEEVEITITGETFIKPNQAYEYKYEGEE